MEIPIAKFTCLACGHSDYRMSSLGFGELLQGECFCGGDLVVVSHERPEWLERVLEILTKHFTVYDFIGTEKHLEAEVESREPERAFSSLCDEIEQHGYLAVLRRRGNALRIFIAKFRLHRENPAINLLLFAVTSLTTFLVGMSWFGDVASAIAFSLSLLLILLAHEAGHFLVAKRNNVQISYPYFIPAPWGTMGAVVRVKKPARNRSILMRVAFAGPLTGFLISLLVISLGTMLPMGGRKVSLPFRPMLFALIIKSPEMGPFLLSGCVMMIVTGMNLLPAGQLDGGHIVRGLMSARSHYVLTRLLGFILLFSGLFWLNTPLWIWGLLILFIFATPHPGALDDISKVSKRDYWIAVSSLLILFCCLPVPVKT